MLSPLIKIRVRDNQDLMALQDNVSGWTEQLRNQAILPGRLIENQIIETTNTDLSHGLGKELTGWVIVRSNADARIWEPTGATSGILRLRASATVTVSLWVF